jgi:uncharacterized protein (TIGR03067 family)
LTAADRPKKQGGLQGKWTVAKAFTGTEPVPDVDKLSVEIGESTLSIAADNKPHEADIKVKAEEKTIDMTPADGRFKGQTLHGIFALKGDTLSLYFAEPEAKRPSKIPAESQAGHFLLVLKRKKGK